MKASHESRRALLMGLPGALGATWLAANWPSLARASEHMHQMMAASGAAKISHLNALETDIATRVSSHIIPSGDSPGAREAGVVYFIDYCVGEQCLGADAEFRKGLKVLDDSARERYPQAAGFAALDDARQLELIHAIERTPFFRQLHTLTVVGLLASPAYGGNQGGAGWQLLGFEDTYVYAPPFGYYDRDYPGFVPYGSESGR